MMRVLSAAAALLLLLTGCSSSGGTPRVSGDGADVAASERLSDLPRLEATEPGGQLIAFDQYELELRPPDGDGEVTLRVYDAADPRSRARGLMQVESLPPRSGMLFRFERPQEGGFWMKNTVLPLSIAFADERGVINDILDMDPCTADPCEIYRPTSMYAYALEVPQGAFKTWGVAEGWSLVVPADLPPAEA